MDPRDGNKPFIIHFQDGDARLTGDPGCPTRVIDFKLSGFNYYTATKSWTHFSAKSSGVGVGSGKADYAIILLDKPVSTSDVDKPVKVAYTSPTKNLTASNIPILGMAGFGLAGWGDPNQKNSLGKPIAINGAREKMYVEMPTLSVQYWNISSQMNAAQADQTACNGDSGSALFLPQPDQSGVYTAYSHVANGDFNCRATNTSTRVDTQEFRNFVNSVAPEIKTAAGL